MKESLETILIISLIVSLVFVFSFGFAARKLDKKNLELQRELNESQTKIMNISAKYSSCLTDLYSQEEINNNLSTELSDYKTKLNRCENSKGELLKSKKLYTPTLKILREFINDDNTDGRIYDADTFDCTSFSNMFIDHFRKKGFYSCLVEIDFDDNTAHNLVAVNTSDMGIIYVEPQTDKMFYSLNIGDDYCDLVNWDCDASWKIVQISDCFRP